MPKTSLQDQIRSLAEKFATDITDQIRTDIRRDIADQILGARNGHRGAARPSAATSGAAGRGQRARSVNVDAVLAYVKANPGQRTEQISKGIGYDAKPALAKLRASGAVKTKGERRATTYTAG